MATEPDDVDVRIAKNKHTNFILNCKLCNMKINT
jgi:hypothetical protein